MRARDERQESLRKKEQKPYILLNWTKLPSKHCLSQCYSIRMIVFLPNVLTGHLCCTIQNINLLNAMIG